MKFFEAQKRAAFAEKLFASINFDFNAALAKNDETALKAAFDAHDNGAAATAELQKELDELAVDYTKLEGELAAEKSEHKKAADGFFAAQEVIKTHGTIFTAIGFDPAAKDKDGKPQDPKAAFEAHVKRATTLELSKTGHPPAHVPAATEQKPEAAKDPAAIYAEYQKMEVGELKQAFYAKHEAAIWAGKKIADQR